MKDSQSGVASLVDAKLAAYRAGSLVITTTGMAAVAALEAPSSKPTGYVLPEDEVVEQPDHFDAALGAVADAAAAAGMAKNEPAATEPNEQPTSAADSGPTTSEAGETAPIDTKPAGQMRTGTKQAQLIEMLKRPEGVTVD
jgi:hypothetical protein